MPYKNKGIQLFQHFIKYLTLIETNILIQKHFFFVYFYIPLRYNLENQFASALNIQSWED
jgi:hypothetical protein